MKVLLEGFDDAEEQEGTMAVLKVTKVEHGIDIDFADPLTGDIVSYGLEVRSNGVTLIGGVSERAAGEGFTLPVVVDDDDQINVLS